MSRYRKMGGSQRVRRRKAIIKRDGPNCHWCHKPDGGTTLDHVIPVSAGGAHALTNLVLACEDCNQERGGIHGPDSFNPGTPSRKKKPA